MIYVPEHTKISVKVPKCSVLSYLPLHESKRLTIDNQFEKVEVCHINPHNVHPANNYFQTMNSIIEIFCLLRVVKITEMVKFSKCSVW